MTTINYAERIRNERKKANLTQAELATKLGIQQSTVASWETGANTPRMKNLLKMASVLGCDISRLFTTTDAP